MSATVRVRLLAVGSCHAKAWLVDGRRGGGELTFPALVAVIDHPGAGTILFDTGYGGPLLTSRSRAARLYRRVLPFRLPEEERLLQQLERIGVPPREVAAVFLSHFHPDHVGSLRELPAVPLIYSREGLDALRHRRGLARLRAVFLPELLPRDVDERARAIEDLPAVALDERWQPFTTAHDVLGDGSLLAVALPGHALGQHGLICRLAGGRELFLVADAAWVHTNVDDLALPAWFVRRLLGDGRALVETLQRLHVLRRRRPELLLVPSHCEASQRAFTASGHGE